MRRPLPLSLLALAAALLTGCGDPAPSTPLAPEQKLPDVSKMTPEQVNSMRQGDHAGDRK